MVGGYYTQYFSTLLKGVRVTALKERIEVRRAINNLKGADHILYKSLFDKVVETHEISKAIVERGWGGKSLEQKLLEELKKSSENAYYLIFNLSTEEVTLLETVEKILKELEVFSQSVGTLSKSTSTIQVKKIEREFVLAIAQALRRAETGEREEFKQIMLIINESEESDIKKFMSAVRLAFQKETQQTMLAKFAARQEIRKIKMDILKLQKIPLKIHGLRRRLTEKGKKWGVEKVLEELKGTIQEIKKECHDAFYEFFLIKKRDIILVLKVLLDLHNLREANIRWTRNRLVPNAQVLEKNKMIVKIQAEISKHFHVIAQAFRIIIDRIEKLEKEAEEDAVKVYRMAA